MISTTTRIELKNHLGSFCAGRGILTQIKRVTDTVRLVLLTDVSLQLADSNEKFSFDHIHLRMESFKDDIPLNSQVCFMGYIEKYQKANKSFNYSVKHIQYRLNPFEVDSLFSEVKKFLSNSVIKFKELFKLLKNKVPLDSKVGLKAIVKLPKVDSELIKVIKHYTNQIQLVLNEIYLKRFFVVGQFTLNQLKQHFQFLLDELNALNTIVSFVEFVQRVDNPKPKKLKSKHGINYIRSVSPHKVKV